MIDRQNLKCAACTEFKTLTLAEMRPLWLHTDPVEVKYRFHKLAERLVLNQMDVLVKYLKT